MSFQGDLLKYGIDTYGNGVKINEFLQSRNLARSQGDVYYVDDSGTDSASGVRGKTPDKPFASIDFAIGQCTANQGDVIYAMPGHAETISTATGLVADIAGISIIGIGSGEDRPKLTLSAAASKVSITAASVRFQNFILISSFTGGVNIGVSLGASANGCVLKDLEFRETANTKEWLIGINVAADCDNILIEGLRYFGIDGGSTTQVIKFAGGSDYSIVRDFLIYVDASGAVIDALTAASLFLTIGNGVIHNLDTGAGLSVSVKSDTTGFMHDLRISALKEGVSPAGAAMAISEVYVSNVIFKQGFYSIAQDA